MTNDLSGLSKAELTQVLDEAEAHIAEIRAELASRESAEQKAAIDGLELPLTRTSVDWGHVKAFFLQVLDELRGERGRK